MLSVVHKHVAIDNQTTEISEENQMIFQTEMFC